MPTSRTRPELESPTDLAGNAVRDISAGLGGLLADVFALYLKTKNFHWHNVGKPLSRLSPAARRAVRPDICHDRSDRRAHTARSAAPRFARSAISRANNVFSTTMRNTSPRRTCCRSCATTTSSLRGKCDGFTNSATNMAMSQRPACSRTGSTKPSAASGSCMNRRARGRIPKRD